MTSQERYQLARSTECAFAQIARLLIVLCEAIEVRVGVANVRCGDDGK